jgi:DNA polymerase III gamma/tau subunit
MLNTVHMIEIMKDNKNNTQEPNPVHEFNTNPVRLGDPLDQRGGCIKKPLKEDKLIKIAIFSSLCIMLGASLISVRAADNPAQAAARMAVEQKFNELDSQTVLPDASVAPSPAVVQAVAKPEASVAVYEKAMDAQTQTAPAPADPVTASVVADPAPVTPAAVASTAATPVPVPHVASAADTTIPVLSFLIILVMVLSFLLLRLLLQNARAAGANQASNSAAPFSPEATPSPVVAKSSSLAGVGR